MKDRLMLPIAVAVTLLALPAVAEQAISLEEAKRIAMENGMVQVEEIERDDRGGWEVEGRDAAGKELELEISASGEVIEKDN